MSAIDKADWFLRAKAFGPIADRLDAHLGWNNYRVAWGLTHAERGLFLCNTASFWIMSPGVVAAGASLIGLAIVAGQTWDLRSLDAAAKRLEADPECLIPREATRFWLRPAWMRLFSIAWGVQFLVLSFHLPWFYWLSTGWFLLRAIADYFAVLPRSGKRRRKVLDRLRSWARGLSFGPQPIGAGA